MTVLILFCGDADATGTGYFGYSIRGLTSPLVPLVGSDTLQGAVSPDYACYTALGKALSYILVNHKAQITPETELRVCTDSRAVIDQLLRKVQCEDAAILRLIEALLEKRKMLGCRVKAELIPSEQNVEARTLARAAFAGRVGKPPAPRTQEPQKESHP